MSVRASLFPWPTLADCNSIEDAKAVAFGMRYATTRVSIAKS